MTNSDQTRLRSFVARLRTDLPNACSPKAERNDYIPNFTA